MSKLHDFAISAVKHCTNAEEIAPSLTISQMSRLLGTSNRKLRGRLKAAEDPSSLAWLGEKDAARISEFLNIHPADLSDVDRIDTPSMGQFFACSKIFRDTSQSKAELDKSGHFISNYLKRCEAEFAKHPCFTDFFKTFEARAEELFFSEANSKYIIGCLLDDLLENEAQYWSEKIEQLNNVADTIQEEIEDILFDMFNGDPAVSMESVYDLWLDFQGREEASEFSENQFYLYLAERMQDRYLEENSTLLRDGGVNYRSLIEKTKGIADLYERWHKTTDEIDIYDDQMSLLSEFRNICLDQTGSLFQCFVIWASVASHERDYILSEQPSKDLIDKIALKYTPDYFIKNL